MSRCGGCTLCCQLLEVKSLKKPAGVLCTHCVEDTGCSIHALRPQECRPFECLWYANPKFPLELRPDHCGVVLEPGGDKVLLAMAPAGSGMAWREGIAAALIEKFLADGTAVIVQVGSEKHFLLPEGDTVESMWERASDGARTIGAVV